MGISCVPLVACGGLAPDEAEMSGSYKETVIITGTGSSVQTEWEVSGSVKWTLGGGSSGSGGSQDQPGDAQDFDANNYQIDTSGSNVAIPNSGTMSVTITDEFDNPVSSRSFAWMKSGSFILASDPSQINSWLLAEQNRGVEIWGVDYVADFVTPAQPGENSVEFVAEYLGAEIGRTRISYHSQVVEDDCHQSGPGIPKATATCDGQQ